VERTADGDADVATDTTLWTLVSVALGGAIGLAASWLIENIKEKNERKKKRAEKLEELVAAVYEFDHYLDRYKNITTYGDPGEEGLSPMSKMEAIATVYFPEFLEKISEVRVTALRYQSALAGEDRRDSPGRPTR
jgi:hypothetical protein